MTDTGPTHRPKLILPLIAGVLLSVYALAYAVILVSMTGGIGVEVIGQAILVFALLLMATTPFFATYWLFRLRKARIGRTVWIMAAVMAVPTLFWGGLYISLLVDDLTYGFRIHTDSLIFVGGPAVLSAWVWAAFVLTGLRDQRASVRSA